MRKLREAIIYDIWKLYIPTFWNTEYYYSEQVEYHKTKKNAEKQLEKIEKTFPKLIGKFNITKTQIYCMRETYKTLIKQKISYAELTIEII